MSTHSLELLRAFDALPLGERQAVAVEVLRRTREVPFDSGPIYDEEIGGTGRSLAVFLDQEENAAGKR